MVASCPVFPSPIGREKEKEEWEFSFLVKKPQGHKANSDGMSIILIVQYYVTHTHTQCRLLVRVHSTCTKSDRQQEGND